MEQNPTLPWTDGLYEQRDEFVDVTNLKTECSAMLGNPTVVDCKHVAWELPRTGSIMLDPRNGPCIKQIGEFPVTGSRSIARLGVAVHQDDNLVSIL